MNTGQVCYQRDPNCQCTQCRNGWMLAAFLILVGVVTAVSLTPVK